MQKGCREGEVGKEEGIEGKREGWIEEGVKKERERGRKRIGNEE